jgi:septal ring factor EnvC (AmiA/AmiB activator)
MEGMERSINNLKKQNSEYSDIGPELTGLRSKVRTLESEKKKFEKELEVEIHTRESQVEELTTKNKELQTELDIRIEDDDRFKNLDL